MSTQTVTIDDIYTSNSQFLKAADLKLKDGKFAKPEVVISDFEVATQQDGKKQIVLFFEGKEKKLGLNGINAERIAAHTGSRAPADWIGWAIRLYVEKVNNPQGQPVDGIRVSAEWAKEPKRPKVQVATVAASGVDEDEIPFKQLAVMSLA